jgi:hypothetical protein
MTEASSPLGKALFFFFFEGKSGKTDEMVFPAREEGS